VFLNLVSNVLRHGTGYFEVVFGEGSLRLENPISADMPDAGRMFERLYAGDASRSNGQMGLGLTTAKLLLEGMGHAISAKVEEGVFVVEVGWKR